MLFHLVDKVCAAWSITLVCTEHRASSHSTDQAKGALAPSILWRWMQRQVLDAVFHCCGCLGKEMQQQRSVEAQRHWWRTAPKSRQHFSLSLLSLDTPGPCAFPLAHVDRGIAVCKTRDRGRAELQD